MPTKNRRVATYLPEHIEQKLEAFKAEHGITGDSQALIVILSEFFGVGQSVAHSSAHFVSSESDRLREFESKLAKLFFKVGSFATVSSELMSELLIKLTEVEQRVDGLSLTKIEGTQLSTGELAKRLGIDSSTLSHWKSAGKKGKSPDELLKATREKDPEGIGWMVDPVSKRFKPEREPSGELPKIIQSELLT